MATGIESTVRSKPLVSSPAEPLLEQGDGLSREEFERRYELMPHVKKAELIEGTVYRPSPIRATKHGEPHGQLSALLVLYASETRGISCFDNATVRLDLAWITSENRFVWWRLVEGQYVEISPDADGLLKSAIFPGLWLDTGALLRGSMKDALRTLRRGLDCPEHSTHISAADSR